MRSFAALKMTEHNMFLWSSLVSRQTCSFELIASTSPWPVNFNSEQVTARFRQLREEGRLRRSPKRKAIGRKHVANGYAPLGFDIGADSPAEIAVSALAEVLSVL